MKKLKINYLYSFVILVLIYVYIITSNLIYFPKYNLEVKEIIGTIESVKINENKITYIVNGKDKVIVNIYDQLPLKIGDVVKVKGELKIPNTNTIFHLFNYRNYLLSDKIYFQMNGDIQKIGETNSIFLKLKRNIVNHIEKYQSKAYLKTFILGDTSSIDNNIMESYRNNGISHLLAISGMHITLLADVIFKLLNKIKNNKSINFIIVSVFLCFYAFLVSFSPSVIRAVSMFILVNIKNRYHLKIKSIDILILLASILLILNPYYIYNLGFIFSFIISFFLMKFGSNGNYIASLFKTSLIAFLASIPILINNFFQINLLTTFFNLFFVPFVSFLIFPISLLTFFIQPLDYLFFNLTNLMGNISLFLNQINSVIVLKAVPFYAFLIYYISIYYILKSKRYYLILIVLFIHANINNFNHSNYLTMVDVGQGDSFLLQLENKNILIDTGGSINFDGSNNLISYFKSRGIKKIDYMILTHGDYDHLGNALSLISKFKVKNVIINSGNDNNYEKMISEKVKTYHFSKNTLKINKATFSFLNDIDYKNENEDSLVFLLEINNRKLLFMGDAGKVSEKYLLDEYAFNKVDILKIGHHGSKNSSSDEFIDSVNPTISLISAGINNRFKHPHKVVTDKLDNYYVTNRDGSVLINLDNLKIKTCPLGHANSC